MNGTWKAIMGVLALGIATAQAAPKAALFVQNRAGAQLESRLDAFNDLVSTRLTEAGFEVIRSQDVLARFTESRRAEAAQELRQGVEALQTVKSEGTVDGPSQEASALRIAQLMGADCLVFASMVSLGENRVRVQSYGVPQEVTTTTFRMALRVLEGVGGSQIYGDTIAVSDKVVQNANLQVEAGDQLDGLLDQGAVELTARVRGSLARIEEARAAAALVTVTLNAPAGAAVELDGVAVGTAPGTFQVRPGVHEVRVTREGYATWEKTVAFADGQTLDIPMELSAVGLARKGELEEQARVDDIAREQSAADAKAKTTLADGAAKQMSESYIRLEGMPQESLTIGDTGAADANQINVIQQEVK